MPVNLDDLERLLIAATPGPWLNGGRIMPEDGCQSLTSEEHADIYRVTENGNRNIACATFSAADADLVVALVNSAPELIVHMRAMREYVQMSQRLKK